MVFGIVASCKNKRLWAPRKVKENPIEEETIELALKKY